MAAQGRITGQRGFTLVELLVTIVVLGVLSGVVVFAVGGISDRGSAAACASDRAVLRRAEETYRVRNSGYASEGELVTAGLLAAQSSLHELALAADRSSFTIVSIGSCVAATTVPATTVLATTTTAFVDINPGGAVTVTKVCTPANRWETSRRFSVRVDVNRVDVTIYGRSSTTSTTLIRGTYEFWVDVARPGPTVFRMSAAGVELAVAALEEQCA